MTALDDAIDLARIGAGKDGYRAYPDDGGVWAGSNQGIADANFRDWGLAGATATILNAVCRGDLVVRSDADEAVWNIDIKGMPSSLNDALRTMELAHEIISKQDRALRSIADSTCCEGCQEAAKIAHQALLKVPGEDRNEVNEACALGHFVIGVTT